MARERLKKWTQKEINEISNAERQNVERQRGTNLTLSERQSFSNRLRREYSLDTGTPNNPYENIRIFSKG